MVSAATSLTPRPETHGWLQFTEASRASTATLSTFFESTRGTFDESALLIKVWSRSTPPRLAAVRGMARTAATRAGEALAPIDRAVLEAQQPVRIANLSSDPRCGHGLWGMLNLHRLVALPLVFAGECLGVLYVIDSHSGPHDTALVDTATALADEAARAVACVRIEYAELRRIVDQVTTEGIRDIARGNETLDELLTLLVARLRPLTGATRGGVMLLESDEWLQLQPGGFDASPSECASYRIRIDDPRSCAAHAFRTRQPTVSNNAHADEPGRGGYARLFGLSRLLTIPLGPPDHPWGVLHLADKMAPFTPEDVHRARIACSQIAHAVSLARTTADLRRARQIEGVLADFAAQLAGSGDFEGALKSALTSLGPLAELDAIAVVRPQSKTVMWPTAPSQHHDVVTRAFQLALLRDVSGVHVTEPTGPGDPGHCWVINDAAVGDDAWVRVAALRRRASFSTSDQDALARLSKLSVLGLQAEKFQQHQALLARMNERQRIANDLHDDLAQVLFMATANLEAVVNDAASPPPALVQARAHLEHGSNTIRGLLTTLTDSPADGLRTQLQRVVSRARESYGLSVNVDLEDAAVDVANGLPTQAVDVLVRVAKEGLANVHKHAQATASRLTLSTSYGAACLTVMDDGAGMKASSAEGDGYGLSSLRRDVTSVGGHLQIVSQRGRGTTVQCRLPLPVRTRQEPVTTPVPALS